MIQLWKWRSKQDEEFNLLTKDFTMDQWEELRTAEYWYSDKIQNPIAKLNYKLNLVKKYLQK